jgi:S-adenosylmethionine/arginine decarboxylase-like enzyme
MGATRKAKLARKKTKKQKKHVQHHHLLLRLETKKCPLENAKEETRDLIIRLVEDIHMKLLGEPRVYYVKYPRYNEGLTALAPIQTSHIAFHFWKNPERKILHSKASHCLLEFDLYTCGSLTLTNIQKILHHFTKFGPTHANITLLNRNYSLTIERQLLWDAQTMEWVKWVDSIPNM